MTARDVAAALSRARALDSIADDAGVVVGVAIDHRDALQRALQITSRLFNEESGRFFTRAVSAGVRARPPRWISPQWVMRVACLMSADFARGR